MKDLTVPKMFNWAVILGVAFITLYGAAASAVTTRYYKATISPTTVNAGALQNDFTITFINCSPTTCDSSHFSSSGQSIKSATILVPSGFSSISSLTTNATNWDVTLNGNTIIATKTGSVDFSSGQSFTVSFKANASCTNGSNTWITSTFQDTERTTAYTLFGPQPTVSITGSCALPEFTGWNSGDYCSYGQGGWGTEANGNNPGSIRNAYFSYVYPNGISVGTPYYLEFTSSSAVQAYLPAKKGAGQLDKSYSNPTTPPGTPAGEFGGQVLSLALNVDFNSADRLGSNLHNYSSVMLYGTNTSLDGKTIAEILSIAETALGGGALPSDLTISALNGYIDSIDNAFSGCEPTEFAQTHLKPGT